MLKLKNVYISPLAKISKSLNYIIKLNMVDFFHKISKHQFSQYQKKLVCKLGFYREYISDIDLSNILVEKKKKIAESKWLKVLPG